MCVNRACVIASLVLCAALCGAAEDPPVRLANGFVLPGEIARVTDDGIEMNTPAGPKTFPWNVLSPATRYRLEPGFRDDFGELMLGKEEKEEEKKPAKRRRSSSRPAKE